MADYIVRTAKEPLIDDKLQKIVPAGGDVHMEPSRAKYLEGMGKVLRPGESMPESNFQRVQRKRKGLTPIETDERAEALARPRATPGMTLASAIETLDHSDDEHWTSGGKPAMDILKDLTGNKNLKRSDVDEHFPDVIRSTGEDEVIEDADGEA